MKNKTKLAIGSDHNGYKHKDFLVKKLSEEYDLIDIGPYDLNKVDYPDISYQMVKLLERKFIDKGILICGTGVGMSISANRYKNINAALVQHHSGAKLAVEHNNSNILCLSSWINSKNINLKISKSWLSANFMGGRHIQRLGKFSGKEKISIVSGVFDLMHQGHIELLRYAKSISSKLIVLINSDKSVKKIKGNTRPINNENTRKQIIESFSFVDEVLIFNETSPGELINKIRPSFFIRGSEHRIEEIRKRDNIDKDINIKIFPIKANYSTTSLIQKIKKLKSYKKNDFLDKI